MEALPLPLELKFPVWVVVLLWPESDAVFGVLDVARADDRRVTR